MVSYLVLSTYVDTFNRPERARQVWSDEDRDEDCLLVQYEKTGVYLMGRRPRRRGRPNVQRFIDILNNI